MRLILALGAAAAATTMIAYAQTEEAPRARNYVHIHHGGGVQIDADDDGWVSRGESSAGADRMFAELDRNDDGRLDESDHPPMPEFEVHIEGPHRAPHVDDNCTRTETNVDGARRVTIVCEDDHEASAGGERRRETHRHVQVERRENGDVIVRREGGGDMVAQSRRSRPRRPSRLCRCS